MKLNRLFPILLMIFSCPALQAQYVEYGEADWYSDKLQGKNTASGELYDKNRLTAAHNTLPMGSLIRVTRLDNNRSVNVRVNDCAGTKKRVVKLSRAAAEEIGLVRAGVARVRIELIQLGQGRPACGKSDPMLPNTYSYNDQFTTRSGMPTPYGAIPQNPGMRMSPILPDGAYVAAALRPYTAGYAVQVASFSKFENAMNKVEELEEKGFENILINVDNNSTYKVIMGPFATESLANSYRENLSRRYKMKGFVVNIATLSSPR